MDVSSRYLFPVCRYLIQSLCFLKYGHAGMRERLANAIEFAAKDDPFNLAHNTVAYSAAQTIIDRSPQANLDLFHAVGISYASFARNQNSTASEHTINSGYEANFNYDTAVAQVAKASHLDCKIDLKRLFDTPLWHSFGEPIERDTNINAYKNFHVAPAFAFWRNWYQGFVDGAPINWELQRRVALIPDPIWDAGPEAVAQVIREIEAEFAGPAPLADAELRTHVAYLLSNPILTEATALNGAEIIERAIADYLREAPANCLPEELRHLEALPQHFKAIARVIGNQTGDDEKETQLIDEISKLHARVAELEKELAVAKSKELKGVISQEAAKAFGKSIGSPYFYGGVAMGVSYFFGVSPSDMTFENLRGYVGELLRANSEGTNPSPSYLPSSTDV
nr:hypothetical protein [Shimia sp. R10_1]